MDCFYIFRSCAVLFVVLIWIITALANPDYDDNLFQNHFVTCVRSKKKGLEVQIHYCVMFDFKPPLCQSAFFCEEDQHKKKKKNRLADPLNSY